MECQSSRSGYGRRALSPLVVAVGVGRLGVHDGAFDRSRERAPAPRRGVLLDGRARPARVGRERAGLLRRGLRLLQSVPVHQRPVRLRERRRVLQHRGLLLLRCKEDVGMSVLFLLLAQKST